MLFYINDSIDMYIIFYANHAKHVSVLFHNFWIYIKLVCNVYKYLKNKNDYFFDEKTVYSWDHNYFIKDLHIH